MKIALYLRTVVMIVAMVLPIVANAAQSRNTPYHKGALIQFGVTPSLLFSFDDYCERDIDVVSCQKGLAMLGFQGDVIYRLPFRWLAIGMVGGLNTELNGAETCSSDSGCSDAESSRIWRMAAEARFYPLLRKRIGLWLAIEAGVVGAAGRAVSDVAPETGGGIGFDIPIGRHLLIGADIRALYFGFGNPPTITPDGSHLHLTNALWTSIGFLKIGARFSL